MILDDDVSLDFFELEVFFVASVVDDDCCFPFCDCVEGCFKLFFASMMLALVDDVAEDIFVPDTVGSFAVLMDKSELSLVVLGDSVGLLYSVAVFIPF